MLAKLVAHTRLRPRLTTLRRVEGFYRATAEEVEAELVAIFTPQQLAEIHATNFAELNLPTLPRSLTEMISEEREDRF